MTRPGVERVNYFDTRHGYPARLIAGAKPELVRTKNSCMNLPYVIDGDVVVTQSNTCAIYLATKLGIDHFGDDAAAFARNHTVLDQTMDLRNDLMKVAGGAELLGGRREGSSGRRHFLGEGQPVVFSGQ